MSGYQQVMDFMQRAAGAVEALLTRQGAATFLPQQYYVNELANLVR